jgi:hypothetical protein
MTPPSLARPAPPLPPPAEEPIEPLSPFSPGPHLPAAVTTGLVRELTARGMTGIYTATTATFAVISVTTGLTVWTDGRLLWCTRAGQRYTWPAADLSAAASALVGLARAFGP